MPALEMNVLTALRRGSLLVWLDEWLEREIAIGGENL